MAYQKINRTFQQSKSDLTTLTRVRIVSREIAMLIGLFTLFTQKEVIL